MLRVFVVIAIILGGAVPGIADSWLEKPSEQVHKREKKIMSDKPKKFTDGKTVGILKEIKTLANYNISANEVQFVDLKDGVLVVTRVLSDMVAVFTFPLVRLDVHKLTVDLDVNGYLRGSGQLTLKTLGDTPDIVLTIKEEGKESRINLSDANIWTKYKSDADKLKLLLAKLIEQ